MKISVADAFKLFQYIDSEKTKIAVGWSNRSDYGALLAAVSILKKVLSECTVEVILPPSSEIILSEVTQEENLKAIIKAVG